MKARTPQSSATRGGPAIPAGAGNLAALPPEQLAAGLITANPSALVGWAVEALASAAGLDLVFVAERVGGPWGRVRTLAVCSDGVPGEDFELDLEGGPWADLPEDGEVHHGERLSEAFPAALLPGDFAAQGAVVLRDSAGRPLGLLAGMSRAPLERERCLAPLRDLAPRLGAALEAGRMAAEVDEVLCVAATAEGDLGTQTRALAQALGVRLAYVAEFLPGDRPRVRTLALCLDDELAEGLTYELAGTPAAGVYDGDGVVRWEDAAERFPGFEPLTATDGRTFLALALRGADGVPLGHLAFAHDQPLAEGVETRPVVRVFAARAASELLRLRDEEARIKIERNLLETQKMESLGLLAGGIAHDFNNLLVGILGSASLARQESAQHPRLRAHLDEIQRSAERAAELARQMLAYSGRAHFVVAALDLNRLVIEMGHLLQVSIPKRVILRVDLEPELPGVVVDATQIRQVLMNLVLNASEAMRDTGGFVRITTGVVQADRAMLDSAVLGRHEPEGSYVYLEVQDDGMGMSASTQVQIFDPFFTTKFTGRGLGLSAVRGIVQGHRGALLLSSREGVGTTFRLLLPASGEAVVGPEGPAPAAPAWRGSGRILVVDDEESVRRASTRLLESMGFEVVAVADGLEAASTLAADVGGFAAVLLDMTMPHPDGHETFRSLRRQDPDVPVVLMTGYAQQEATRRFEEGELAGFLQKPFTVENLREQMRAVLEA